MARSSTRKQVVFMKAKKHLGLAASKRRPAPSPVDRARAANDKMVGAPAKLSRPFIVPAPRQRVSENWWLQACKAVAMLLGVTALFGSIFFLAGKLRPAAAHDYDRPVSASLTSGSGSPARRGNMSGGYPGSQQASAESQLSNRAPPTDESFVSTYGGLNNHDRAPPTISVSTTGSPTQHGNTDGQLSNRAQPMDESLFAAYDGVRKPVYLPNISGNCVIKEAGINAFGECLRQQMQGFAQSK